MGDPREIPCRMCKNGYQRDNTKKVFLKHEESVLKTWCASSETCSVVSLSLSLSLSLSVHSVTASGVSYMYSTQLVTLYIGTGRNT